MLKLSKNVVAFYYGTQVNLEFSNADNNKLSIGYAMLTRAGQQLAAICGSTPSLAFFEYVIEKWIEANITVSMPIGSKPTFGEQS